MKTVDLDKGRARRRRPAPRAGGAASLAVLLLSTLVAPSQALAAHEVSGVTFDPLSRVDGRSLELTGLGLHRYRVFIKLYAMALYVPPGLRDDALTAEDVLASDAPKRLELQTFWAIPAEIFRRMTRERIARAVSPDEYEQLAPSIEALNALYEDVEPGDRYAITYLPGRGTELTKNGVARGVVEGEPFARAMFGIWLGDEPFDRKLRSKLLEDVR